MAQQAAPMSYRAMENGTGGCCTCSIYNQIPILHWLGPLLGTLTLWHFWSMDHSTTPSCQSQSWPKCRDGFDCQLPLLQTFPRKMWTSPQERIGPHFYVPWSFFFYPNGVCLCKLFICTREERARNSHVNTGTGVNILKLKIKTPSLGTLQISDGEWKRLWDGGEMPTSLRLGFPGWSSGGLGKVNASLRVQPSRP